MNKLSCSSLDRIFFFSTGFFFFFFSHRLTKLNCFDACFFDPINKSTSKVWHLHKHEIWRDKVTVDVYTHSWIMMACPTEHLFIQANTIFTPLNAIFKVSPQWKRGMNLAFHAFGTGERGSLNYHCITSILKLQNSVNQIQNQ